LAPSLGAKPEIPVGPPSVAQCKLQSPLGDRRRLRGGLESQGRLRRPGFEGERCLARCIGLVKWLAFAYAESHTAIMIQVVGRLP